MARREVHLFDAFPELASEGQVCPRELKQKVLAEHGHDTIIRAPRGTRPIFVEGTYSQIPGGTVMKPYGAIKNLREDVARDPWDITFYDDGSWTFEVDHGHPMKAPVEHWRLDLTTGEKIVTASLGLLAGLVFFGLINVVAKGLRA